MARVENGECREALLYEVLKRLGLAGWQSLAADARPYNDSFARSAVGRALTIEQLQKLPSRGAAQLARQCVVLPIFPKDNSFWIPFLWINFPAAERIRIQMVVVGMERRCGFRWESPESGAVADGKHDFWHAQPLISVQIPQGHDYALDLKHNHISDHFPTFPIDADNAVQLLDALMVSLYGPLYTIRMIEDAFIREQLHSCSADRLWAAARNSMGRRQSVPEAPQIAKSHKKKGR